MEDVKPTFFTFNSFSTNNDLTNIDRDPDINFYQDSISSLETEYFSPCEFRNLKTFLLIALCSYVKSHALGVWHKRYLNCTRKKKKKENYRTFTHAFYNICEYIFQTSYVKFFLKTSVFYAWMNN